MPKLETLELEIVQKSKTSTAGVKSLAEALSNLAKAGEAAGSLKPAATSLKAIAAAADGLKAASSGIRSMAGAMARLGESLGESTNAVDGLQKIAVALEKISEAASGISGVGSSIREINRAAKDAGKIPETPGGGNGLPTAGDDIVDGESSGALDETAKKAEETRQNVGEATSAVHAFRDSLRSLGKGALSIGKSLGKRMLGNFTKDIKSAVSTMGNLFSSFKRIAMYRGLRTAIKAITQGFATGVKHLYAWADLVGNNFKQSMDSLSTSMNYMRNSLGAMVSPIIDALAPAVDILVDKFVDLINVVNQFLATITGASSWRRAVKEQKEYADETDKAAGAQKRLNHQLMAFDELNNITVNQPSSRGSGNKDDEVTDGSFVVEQLPDWAKDIREAIENGMWKTAGALLAQKLNGLIDSWDANAFGKKLGEKFQNGIDAYLGFMKTFKWNQLGIKAADFINGILSNVNPSDLGEAIVQKFNAAVGFLNGFAKTLNWDEVGTWCVDVLFGAINGIQWETLGDTIGTIISGISTMIISAFNELIKHPGDIVDAVTGFFKGLFEGLWGEDGSGLVNVISVVGLIAGFKLLFGNAIPAAITGLGSLVSGAFTSLFSGSEVSGAISSGVKTAVETGVSGVSVSTSVFGNMLSGLGSAFVSFMGTWGLPILGTVGITAGVLAAARSWDKQNDEDFERSKADPSYGKSVAGMLQDYISAGNKVLAGDSSYLFEMNQLPSTLSAATRGEVMLDTVEDISDVSLALAKAQEYLKHYTPGGNLPTSSTPTTGQNTPGARLDPTTGEWFVPEIDTTQQVKAIKAVETAAKGARSKVKQIPPSEDEVSIFTTRLKTERTSVDGVKTAANNAGKAIDGVAPTYKQTNAFKDTATVWGKAVNGIKTAAAKAGAELNGVKPTAKENKAFQDSTSIWANAVNGIKSAASNTNKEMDKVAKKRSATVSFTTEDYVKTKEKVDTVQKMLDALSGKTYSTKLKMTVEALNGGTSGQQLVVHNYWGSGLSAYAEGGYPKMGDLFIANEAGPELVGTINGKTAVSSNQEITGIADAVYNTGEEEATLLREQNQLLRQLLAKNTNISLAPNVAAGRWVAQASNAYRKATGG